MPRRALLTEAQLEPFLNVPFSEEEVRRHYTLDEPEMSLIRQRRGVHNRLGFAVQLCYLRYPGRAMAADTIPSEILLSYVAGQLRVPVAAWAAYAERDETRREHAIELQSAFGYRPFTLGQYRHCHRMLTELALQTNKALILAEHLLSFLRKERVLHPRSGGDTEDLYGIRRTGDALAIPAAYRRHRRRWSRSIRRIARAA